MIIQLMTNLIVGYLLQYLKSDDHLNIRRPVISVYVIWLFKCLNIDFSNMTIIIRYPFEYLKSNDYWSIWEMITLVFPKNIYCLFRCDKITQKQFWISDVVASLKLNFSEKNRCLFKIQSQVDSLVSKLRYALFIILFMYFEEIIEVFLYPFFFK